MEQTKLIATVALAMGLSASAAYAHEIPAPTAGDPYNITEPTISWNGGAGTSTNNTLGDDMVTPTVLAYHFDVTSAGSLDVYTNDHDDPNSIAALYVYKKDDIGADWTLTNYSFEGPRINPQTPTNIFGVHITGYLDQNNTGTSDSGIRADFGLGSYVALVVGEGGRVTGYAPGNAIEDPTGAKLSGGFTWSFTGDKADQLFGLSGLSDLTIKASPGSLAMAGPTVEAAPVPVPGAVWLMGTALAGFVTFGRKKASLAA